MSDGVSAGIITLDLVIKNQISKQLEKIKSDISKPIESISEQANSILKKSFDGFSGIAENAMGQAIEIVDEGFGTTSKIANEMLKSAQENCMKAVRETTRIIEDDSSKPIEKTVKIKWEKYDTSEIIKGIEDFANGAANATKIATAAISETKQKAEDSTSEFINEIHEKIESFEISTDPVDRMKQELQNTQEQISLTQKKWQELKTELDGLSDEEIALGFGDKLKSEKLKIEKNLLSMQASAEKTEQRINESLSGKEISPKGFARITEGFAEIKQGAGVLASKIKSVGKAIGSFLISPLKGVGNTAVTIFKAAKDGIVKSFSKLKYYLENPLYALRDSGKKIFNTLKSTGSKAVLALKNKFSGLKGSVDNLNKPFTKLVKSIKSAVKSVFLMAGAYAAFRAIKNAVSEACKSNDEFSNSLNEIKANLIIAFQPVMQAIMPAINSLVSGLARVTKYLATFMSELFGSTYKKSLDTVKKIKEVGKEAQKNSTYLAGFDEMNVAQDASEDSSSESSSDESGIDWSKISGEGAELPDWAEKLKAAIKSGDWEGVGKILAQRINSVIASIKWKKLQDKINKGAKSLAKGLNGFVKGVNWTKLGNSIGEGLNTIFGAGYSFMSTFDWDSFGTGLAESVDGAVKTADWSLIGKTFASKWNAIIDTAYAFVTNFDFKSFGTSVGTSVNTWFEEIDFAKAGKTLGETVKGILDTGISFLQTVDWQEVGEKVWAFIKSVDWGGIVSRLFELIGSLIGASVSLLWGFIKDAVYSIRDYFKEQIEDCGGNIVEGLFMGIGGALVNLGTWIKEHVFDPFINGFKKCFGIHSPSKVMDEQGGFIMQGLLDGITSRVDSVINKFKEVLRKIKKVFTSIPSWFKTKFSDALDKVKEAFSLKSIKEHFTSIKDKIVEIFGGLKDALKEPLNWVIDLINKCIGGLNSLSIDIPDWVPEFGGSTFGFNIPEIPRLATGGLATAPTLAMVGDNRNAATDPEAILPVSKLQEMLDTGRLEEVAQLLREILALLQGLNFNLTATVDRRVLFQIIREMNEQYKRRTGVSAFE